MTEKEPLIFIKVWPKETPVPLAVLDKIADVVEQPEKKPEPKQPNWK